MLRPQADPKDVAIISFLFGIIISTLFALSFLILIMKNSEPNISSGVSEFFSSFVVFRFIFFSLFAFWLICVAKYIFQMKQLNYFYVLDIRPQNVGNVFKNIKALGYFTVLYLLLIVLDLLYDFSTLAIVLSNFPTTVIFFSFSTFIFMPLDIWFRNTRYALISALFDIIISPFGVVTFLHVIIADSLCSFTRPLIDLANSFCWFKYGYFTPENVPLNNTDVCQLGEYITFLQMLPYCLRFLQCLKRYYTTRLIWPNLFNAVKYLLSILALVFGAFFIDSSMGLWLGFGIVSFLYNNIWDNCVDWGLFRITNKANGKFLLRERIRFSPSMYYTIMILNFFFRLSWLVTIIPQNSIINYFSDPNFFLWFTGSIEILRRFLWSLIRVENEINANIEKLRQIDLVPKVFFVMTS